VWCLDKDQSAQESFEKMEVERMKPQELEKIRNLYQARLISESEVINILLLAHIEERQIEENFDSYIESEVSRRQAA